MNKPTADNWILKYYQAIEDGSVIPDPRLMKELKGAS